MGKVVKGFVIGACVCIAVGIAFFVGASMAGGISMIEEGVVFGISSDDFMNGNTANKHTISLTDMEKPNLELELGAGKFEIIESDTSDIVVKSSKKIRVTVEGDDIRISTAPRWFVGINIPYGKKHNNVIIEVPEGMVFDDVVMEIGAGELECPKLSADSIQVELGAGLITMDGYECDEATLSVGAGKIVVENGFTNDMDIEVGMGELELYGRVKGNLDVDCGMGSVLMKLEGVQQDYNYQIDCGMGNITVGENSYGGVATNQDIDNHADTDFDLDCGMGNIEICFMEQ